MDIGKEPLDLLEMRLSQLKEERYPFESHWKEISSYELPFYGRALFTTDELRDMDGGKCHELILDNIAEQDMDTLSSGLLTGMSSPASPWFRLILGDKDLMKYRPIKEWLEIVQRRMYYVYGKSNFYQMAKQMYQYTAGFGTGAQMQTSSYETVMRCYNYDLGTYWLGSSAERRVDTFYREFNYNALQLISEFGMENVSTTVKDCYRTNEFKTKFKCIHCIEPHDDRIDFKLPDGMMYRSAYYQVNDNPKKEMLAIKGFRNFPMLTPRWELVGDNTYGRSQGMRILADVKELQKLKEDRLVAIDKIVDPPIKAMGAFSSLTVDYTPGGVTFSPENAGNHGLEPLYQISPNLQHLMEAINDCKRSIGRGAYRDLFRMFSQDPVKSGVTATEIVERYDEKLVVLAPPLRNHQEEFLSRSVNLTFDNMQHQTNENGESMIPEMPKELQGKEIEIEYTSILAQAQKLSEAKAVERMMSFVGQVAQMDPSVIHKLNFNATVDEYAEIINAPSRMIVSDRDAIKKAQAIQAKQEQRDTMEGVAGAAQAAKTMGETDMGDGNNALASLLGGPTQ